MNNTLSRFLLLGTGHRQSNNPIRSVFGFVNAKRQKLNSLENVMHSILGKQTYKLEWSSILTMCSNGGSNSRYYLCPEI